MSVGNQPNRLAAPELDRLRAQEGLTPWELDHLRWAIENYPGLTPEKALEMLRAFGM